MTYFFKVNSDFFFQKRGKQVKNSFFENNNLLLLPQPSLERLKLRAEAGTEVFEQDCPLLLHVCHQGNHI